MTDSEDLKYLLRMFNHDVLPRLNDLEKRVAGLEREVKREGWFRRVVRSWLDNGRPKDAR